MTREIKFRAWNGKVFNYFELKNFKGFHKEFDLINIQQFTGLKDKNGKEIYEGDIVKWFADGVNKFAFVKWSFNGYVAKRIGIFKDMEYQFQSFIPVVKDRFDGEVIGNIHKSPELINKLDRQNETEESG